MTFQHRHCHTRSPSNLFLTEIYTFGVYDNDQPNISKRFKRS